MKESSDQSAVCVARWWRRCRTSHILVSRPPSAAGLRVCVLVVKDMTEWFDGGQGNGMLEKVK